MVFILFLAALAIAPLHPHLSFGILLLFTFSFFISISMSILFFKTENTLMEAFKASMLATIALQISYYYVYQVLQHTVTQPLHALIFLSFFGVLLAVNFFTRLGKPKSMVTAAVGMGSIWGAIHLLNNGFIQFLLGPV
jgi:hypothetical protein